MSPTTIIALYIWTISIGRGDGRGPLETRQDWRYAGDFASAKHCESAALQLELRKGTYLCLDTGRKP